MNEEVRKETTQASFSEFSSQVEVLISKNRGEVVKTKDQMQVVKEEVEMWKQRNIECNNHYGKYMKYC